MTLFSRTIFAAILVFMTSAVQAALVSRLGGQAYYDTELDITWAQNANINGQDTWDGQVSWVSGLTIAGVSGWRLPNMDVDNDGTIVDCASVAEPTCRDNEYGYMYHQNGVSFASPGMFANVQSGSTAPYWSATKYAPSPSVVAWAHNFSNGSSVIQTTTNPDIYAWAVHSGDVVPIPAAAWLFGSALGLLAWVRSKSHKTHTA